MKKRIISILLTGAVAVGVAGCGLLPKEEELPTAPVLAEAETDEYVVSPVVRGDVRITENIRANYIPSSSEKLGFQLGDEKIARIYVSTGDVVKAGDVLMELDVTALNDQIRRQQDQLSDLNLQLAHLYETESLKLSQAQAADAQAAENSVVGWISQVDDVLDQYSTQAQQIKNSIQVAEKRLEELQEQVKERQIVASIDGTVVYMYEFQDGERSVEDRKVITLADMSQALFEVYSENGDLLESGKTYTLICRDTEYEVVARSAEELNLPNLKEGNTYLTMVEADPNLEQGVSGSITVVMEESLGTLYVTSSAVKNLRGETVVYTLDEQGYRQMRPVKTGLSDGKITEILEGLEEGEVVIVE